MTIMYHDGNRRLQDQFDSRRISDRLEEKLTRTAFTADDKAFIESTIYFFMSTADAEGRPDCSFKGGAGGLRARHRRLRTGVPGLRRQRHVQEPRQRAGQSECRTAVHRPARAPAPSARERHARRVSREDPLLAETIGAQMIVRVKARAIFPNCPRYIPKMQLAEPSVYVPQARQRSGRARLEGLRHLQGLRAPAPADGALIVARMSEATSGTALTSGMTSPVSLTLNPGYAPRGRGA